MSCCGGNCGCGSQCKCSNGCNGCGMSVDIGSSEQTRASRIAITGVAPVTVLLEESEMSFGAVNRDTGCGCNCGSNCSCKC